MDIFHSHSTLSLSQYLTISRNIPQSRLHITRTPHTISTQSPHLTYPTLTQLTPHTPLFTLISLHSHISLTPVQSISTEYQLYLSSLSLPTIHMKLTFLQLNIPSPIAYITSPIPPSYRVYIHLTPINTITHIIQ